MYSRTFACASDPAACGVLAITARSSTARSAEKSVAGASAETARGGIIGRAEKTASRTRKIPRAKRKIRFFFSMAAILSLVNRISRSI
jgi:hypothetical protein